MFSSHLLGEMLFFTVGRHHLVRLALQSRMPVDYSHQSLPRSSFVKPVSRTLFLGRKKRVRLMYLEVKIIGWWFLPWCSLHPRWLIRIWCRMRHIQYSIWLWRIRRLSWRIFTNKRFLHVLSRGRDSWPRAEQRDNYLQDMCSIYSVCFNRWRIASDDACMFDPSLTARVQVSACTTMYGSLSCGDHPTCGWFRILTTLGAIVLSPNKWNSSLFWAANNNLVLTPSFLC